MVHELLQSFLHTTITRDLRNWKSSIPATFAPHDTIGITLSVEGDDVVIDTPMFYHTLSIVLLSAVDLYVQVDIDQFSLLKCLNCWYFCVTHACVNTRYFLGYCTIQKMRTSYRSTLQAHWMKPLQSIQMQWKRLCFFTHNAVHQIHVVIRVSSWNLIFQ